MESRTLFNGEKPQKIECGIETGIKLPRGETNEVIRGRVSKDKVKGIFPRFEGTDGKESNKESSVQSGGKKRAT